MKFRLSFTGVWYFLFIFCVSCEKDPELLEKRDRQQAEIARLQSEVALAEVNLRDMPEDKSDELKAAESNLDVLASEAVQLESEVAKLRQRKAALEEEYAAYQKKYPIN